MRRARRLASSSPRANGGRRPRRSAAGWPSWRRGRRSRPARVRCGRCWRSGTRRPQRVDELLRACRELGQRTGAAIGVSELRDSPADAAGAYREARDAATIGRALLRDGGAIAYSQVGAYRYLVQIGADDAPRDRMRAAVDR